MDTFIERHQIKLWVNSAYQSQVLHNLINRFLSERNMPFRQTIFVNMSYKATNTPPKLYSPHSYGFQLLPLIEL